MIKHFRRTASWIKGLYTELSSDYLFSALVEACPCINLALTLQMAWEFFTLGNFFGLMYTMSQLTKKSGLLNDKTLEKYPARTVSHYKVST